MLFTENKISNEELKTITNFFESFESEVTAVSPEEASQETSVSKYITSLTTGLMQSQLKISQTQTLATES